MEPQQSAFLLRSRREQVGTIGPKSMMIREKTTTNAVARPRFGRNFAYISRRNCL